MVTRVLVVDDEPQILRALRINLRVRQYDVHTAATGTQALELAAKHPPDLVILDLGLPDLDGVEVIQGLRGWTDAPIIVLSGRADSTDKVEALDAGADDYVTKPFGMDELLARMRAVGRRRPATAMSRRSASVTSSSTSPPSGSSGSRRARPHSWHVARAPATSGSRRPSGTCSRCCCAIPASCSASSSCLPRSGGPATPTRPATSGSTWRSCAASWSPTRPGRAGC